MASALLCHGERRDGNCYRNRIDRSSRSFHVSSLITELASEANIDRLVIWRIKSSVQPSCKQRLWARRGGMEFLHGRDQGLHGIYSQAVPGLCGPIMELSAYRGIICPRALEGTFLQI